MSGSPSDSSEGLYQRGKFQETLWGQVFAAGKQDSSESQGAMAKLYQVYWPPIYCYLRRSGQNNQKAKDLAQDFFAYLWEQNLAAKADPDRGKFRNFLIGVLKRYVRHERRQERTVKAGCQVVSIDAEADEGYLNEPATQETPETIFEREWALKVVDEAMRRLEAEYAAAGQTRPFQILKPCLDGENEERYAALAQKLVKSEGATRTDVCRLRARHRDLILAVISDTLVDKRDAEKEFAHLVAILRHRK